MIERARSVLIIHSTFLGMEALGKVFPLLVKAARERGVIVHLFHGKDDRVSGLGKSGKAIAHAQELIRSEKIGSFIRLHPFTTRSHAKLIVADDGAGKYKAVIGSCNWLSTAFNPFEASVVLDEPKVVGAILNALADMAFQATGREAGIALDLAGLALNLGRQRGRRGGAMLRSYSGRNMLGFWNWPAMERLTAS